MIFPDTVSAGPLTESSIPSTIAEELPNNLSVWSAIVKVSSGLSSASGLGVGKVYVCPFMMMPLDANESTVPCTVLAAPLTESVMPSTSTLESPSSVIVCPAMVKVLEAMTSGAGVEKANVCPAITMPDDPNETVFPDTMVAGPLTESVLPSKRIVPGSS